MTSPGTIVDHRHAHLVDINVARTSVAGAPTGTLVLIVRASETHDFPRPSPCRRSRRVRHLSDADVRPCCPPRPRRCGSCRGAGRTLGGARRRCRPNPRSTRRAARSRTPCPPHSPSANCWAASGSASSPTTPATGLPTASGLMVVNDGETGVPRAVMSAGALTAARTAAVSGACVAPSPPPPALASRSPAPASRPDPPAGARGTRPPRRHGLRAPARGPWTTCSGGRRAETPRSPASHRRPGRGGCRAPAWSSPPSRSGCRGPSSTPAGGRTDALVLPLDYASSVGPALAPRRTLAADDLPQFEAVRAPGTLGDYPAATQWTGELLRRRPRPSGRVVCQNLGNGLSDLVVAGRGADAAETRGRTPAGHRARVGSEGEHLPLDRPRRRRQHA